MKPLSASLLISMTIFLFSCGSEPAKEETKADTTAAVAAEPAPAKPVFTPFKVVVIQHKVKNFDKSLSGYFNRDSLRMASGIDHFVLGRDLKDSNTVFVMDKIEDVDKAKAFFKSPKTEAVMKQAGVSRAPGFTYGEIVRGSDAVSETPLRVSVTHHVKDYDAWLKAFDAEGAATRAANGLVTQAIGRNLYDSNTVTIIFAVTDMEKAKARVASPELKKIMTDAGVDGTPAIRWFKIVKGGKEDIGG
jgi:quinol monooxygenase YgiN